MCANLRTEGSLDQGERQPLQVITSALKSYRLDGATKMCANLRTECSLD